MLTEVEQANPNDVAVLKGIGRALLLGKKPLEAVRAFQRVLQLSPGAAAAEEDVGVASLECGQLDQAATHLERALGLDPLQLSAVTALQAVYRNQGYEEKAAALGRRIERAMEGPPLKPAR